MVFIFVVLDGLYFDGFDGLEGNLVADLYEALIFSHLYNKLSFLVQKRHTLIYTSFSKSLINKSSFKY